MINIFLMDAMGGLEINNGIHYIKQLPVRLYINFTPNDLEEEAYFKITLTNPDNRISASFKRVLSIDIKEFSPILPIKNIIGEWKLNINISGAEVSNLQMKLKLATNTETA